MAVKIIDVSKHNVINDWKKVKASGVDGVIIRAGYGRHISQKDPTFEKYYYGAKAADAALCHICEVFIII